MGKTLIPHLGANWNNGSGEGLNIVLEPKQNKNKTMSRKRSFQSMNNGENDKNMPPKKKSKLEGNDASKEKKNIAELQKKEDLITSKTVTVYICKQKGCSLQDKAQENPNMFCKSHSMNIVKTSGKKYFWKCDNVQCGNKIQTLNTKRMKTKCRKCGRKSFVPSAVYDTPKKKNKK